MKSASEHALEIWEAISGHARNEVKLIEARDREVTAKALRDAAENIGVLKSGGGRGAYGMAAAMLRDMAERAERGES